MARPPEFGAAPFAGPWESGPQRLQGAGPGEGRRARKVLLFTAMAVLCAVLGINLVFFPPVFLFGAILGLLAVFAVLSRPFLGLVLYAALFLVRPGELYPSLAGLHIERIVGVVTLAAMFFSSYRKEGKLFLDGSRQTQLLVLLLAAFYCSVPSSYWPSRSLGRVVEFLKIIAFYVMIVQLVDSRKRLRILLAEYLILIAVIGYTSLRAYFAGELMVAQGIERAVGVTSAGGNPNALGATLGSTVPLLIMTARATRRAVLRWFLFGGVGVLVWAIALTGSRSSVLGLLAGLAVVWWFSRHRLLVAVFGLLLLGTAFVALPDSYKARYESITSENLDESSRLRLTTWEAGMKMVLDRPFFGVGVGAFSTAHHSTYGTGLGSWLEAHNLYVQVPAEIGLVGAIVYFSFLAAFIRLNRRARRTLTRRRPDWKLEAGILDGIFAGTCFLFVSSIFGHSMLRFTWYVFAAMTLVVYRLHVDLPVEANPPVAGRADERR